MILYYKNGQLKMMSETPIETDMDFITKDLSLDEKEKIKDINWERKIEDGELIFEKSKETLDKEAKLDKISRATTLKDLKEIIIDLIK